MRGNMGKWPWEGAFPKQEDQEIRSPDGCGDDIPPSNRVRRYNPHKLKGYLGNVG